MKIAIDLASLRQATPQALATAARLGASGVVIDARHDLRPRDLTQTALRQIRKKLDDLGLKVAAITFRTRRGYDDPDELEARLEATRQAMKMAAALGSSVVINQVGMAPREDDNPRWQQLLSVLRDLGQYGHHVGAWLAAETGHEDGEALRQLLDALPEGTLGIDFNPGQLIIHGHNVQESLRQLGSNILHIHASDGVRDLARGRGLETQLGRGSSDFPEIVANLEEFNYRGWFTISRQGSDDPLTEVAAAVKYLQNLTS